MKKIAIACTLGVLAACSQTETAPEPEATEATTAAAETERYKLEPGTFEYTRSDGTSGINTMAEDGTYSNARTGGTVETGKWAEEGDLSCLTPDDGSAKRCYTFTQPDAEGNFTGTTPEGVTVEVRKIA